MVVNIPLIRPAISWGGGWHSGGTLRIPWKKVVNEYGENQREMLSLYTPPENELRKEPEIFTESSIQKIIWSLNPHEIVFEVNFKGYIFLGMHEQFKAKWRTWIWMIIVKVYFLLFGPCSFVPKIEMHIIWSNNSDLSRWFSQRIPPKCPKHSGLGIIFCRDIILAYQPYPTLKWFEMMWSFHYFYLFLGVSKCACIRFGSYGGTLPCDIWPGKSSLVLMEPCSTLFNSDFLMPILAFKTYPPWN